MKYGKNNRTTSAEGKRIKNLKRVAENQVIGDKYLE